MMLVSACICRLCLLLAFVYAGSGRSLHSIQSEPQQPSVGPMLKNVYRFWLQHGPDHQYGGFHGTLDRQGNPIPPTTKTLVQQARHLWSFSTFLMAQPQQWGFKAELVRRAADSAYAFMRDNMLTNDTLAGGRLFVYETTRDGAVSNSSINLYGNAFAVYGLSSYAQATGSQEALQLATNTVSTLDQLFHSNTTGGYDETTAHFALHSIQLRGFSNSSTTPDSLSVTADRSTGSVVRDSDNGGCIAQSNSTACTPRLSQSLNTLLHMTEALTELSKASRGSNPAVTARLLELVQLLTGPLVVRTGVDSGPNRPAAYLAPNYNPLNWTPVLASAAADPTVTQRPWPLGDYVDYGHNLEAAWLFADSVEELQTRGAVNSSTAAGMLAVLQEIAEAAVTAGYDATHGGIFDGSILGAPSPTSPYKIWWAQAEALLGLSWLHNRTADVEYNTLLQQTIGYIANNLEDQQYGEWYWQCGPSGCPVAFPGPAGGPDFAATVKGTAWKASYHTGRALLRMVQAGY